MPLILLLALGVSCSSQPQPYAQPPAGRPQQETGARVQQKLQAVRRLVPQYIRDGGDRSKVRPLMEQLDGELQGRPDPARLEPLLDQILMTVKGRMPDERGGVQPEPRPVPAETAARAGGRAAGLSVAVYDASGKEAPAAACQAALVEHFVTGVFALDMDYNPIPDSVVAAQRGGIQLRDDLPEPFMLQFYPKVDGFGQVKVYADNEGRGYRRTSAGAAAIDLPLEAARSRVAKTRALMARYPAEAFRPETMERLQAAEGALEGNRGDRAAADRTFAALRDALWAGELAAVDGARHAIAQRGRREGFLFGAWVEGHDRWPETTWRQFEEVFNFATVENFFLRDYEPEEGRPAVKPAEDAVAECERRGLAVKGHPLVYLTRMNLPDWLKRADYGALREAMKTRILRDVAAYKGRMAAWDMVNECHMPLTPLTPEQRVEITRLAGTWTAEADPEALRIVNVAWPTGDYVMAPALRNKVPADRLQTPRQYLEAVINGGAAFDVVGLQFYYPGLDMLELSILLDRYAQLGKPIHITEIGVASAPGVDREGRAKFFRDADFIEALGEWHRPWDEETQADWIEQCYTIAYAKPAVTAISYTHMQDYFWPYGGLLHPDLTPKASYYRLRELLASWGYGKGR